MVAAGLYVKLVFAQINEVIGSGTKQNIHRTIDVIITFRSVQSVSGQYCESKVATSLSKKTSRQA